MNKTSLNKLTGLPISEEMLDVLDRLEQNIDIPLEKIQKLPEMQEAYSCINNSSKTSLLKNRESLQEGVLKKLLQHGSANIDSNGKSTYNGEVGRNSRIDIVIGLPASGKSSALVDPISQKYKSRIIDSDEAKKLLPEFNNGWGAGVVHEESKYIKDKLLISALDNNENIVYPIVGSNYETLKEQIKSIKSANYKVYLHYNDIPKNKALGRMLLRFLEQGRFLDPKLSYKYENKVDQVYEQLKKEGDLIDGYSKWNNDVERGEKARFIEGTEGTSRIIYDNIRDGNGLRGSHNQNAAAMGSKEKREVKEGDKGIGTGKIFLEKLSIMEKLKENKNNLQQSDKRRSNNRESGKIEKTKHQKER